MCADVCGNAFSYTTGGEHRVATKLIFAVIRDGIASPETFRERPVKVAQHDYRNTIACYPNHMSFQAPPAQ